jgi:hypothetical protein
MAFEWTALSASGLESFAVLFITSCKKHTQV